MKKYILRDINLDFKYKLQKLIHKIIIIVPVVLNHFFLLLFLNGLILIIGY